MADKVMLNRREFENGLDNAYTRLLEKFKKRNRKLVTEAMRRLIRRTPVHTGQAVRNYVATYGSPYTGPVKPGRKPVEATNPLSVGAEQLRGGAEAEAMGTISGVNFSDPFAVFYITNRAPQISGLEAGELPKEPFSPRSPMGMFAVTMQEIISLLDTGRI